MGKRDLFIYSSGIFAILCPTDPVHQKSVEILKKAEQENRFAVTSDYILDEVATLFMARKFPHLVRTLFGHVRKL